MRIFYFDSSALVKLYKSELGSDIMEVLFAEKRSEESFTTSFLSVIEVSSVMRRSLAGREISTSRYRALIASFQVDLAAHFRVQPVSDNLLMRALAAVDQHALRSLDSIQIATALAVRTDLSVADELLLVAGDKDILRAAIAEGLQVFDPEDALASDKLSSLRAAR